MTKILIGLLISISTFTTSRAELLSYQETGKHPLIVVHASTVFNEKERGKKSLDHLINKFKNTQSEVYYLSSEEDSQNRLRYWYVEDKDPTEIIYSYGGENNIISEGAEFTVAGGFLGAGVSPDDPFPEGKDFVGCLTNAIANLISNHFKHYNQELKINISVNSVYTPKRDDKELKEHFYNPDVRGFIAWLITDDDRRALKDYPTLEHDESKLPFDLEKVLAKNYQCNYQLDKDCSYLVYDSFWNVFEKSPYWRINAPTSGTGTDENVSYQIKRKGKLIAYIGNKKNKVILNFID
ncbi:hypothetical protein [Halobacteriovorax sp.]|uniref:hypothetical protein n=1 Tax=Halobacteriovorax sp. TaxID=2020862 RepID=UPI0035622781